MRCEGNFCLPHFLRIVREAQTRYVALFLPPSNRARSLKRIFIGGLLICLLPFHALCVAQRQKVVVSTAGSSADGKVAQIKEPALTGERHPLYRLRKSDVLDIHFTFAPEFDQTITIQPDGYVALKGAGNFVAEGLTLTELTAEIAHLYSFMRDPEISVNLKDFDKPFFLAAGQVGRPGKYELRSPTTVTQGIALAGGFTEQSKHSQVVLFRKVSEDFVESRVLNVKAMLASRKLDEDADLRPGDMLFIPQNRISKIKKFLPVASLSTFFTPAQF